MPKLSRRDALSRFGRAAAVLGGSAAVGVALWDRDGVAREGAGQQARTRDYRVQDDRPTLPQLVIAKTSTDPEVLTRAAVDGLGGMARFVARGDVVAIKPNIGWDRTPVQAANTNPRVVATLVRMALDAGAKRVIVADSSCNEASRSFQRSGIWRAAHDAGAEVILPADHRFRTIRLGGEVLHEWPIFRPVIDADKIINAPVVKHHKLAKLTGAMKNWYGLLGGRRNRLHQNIDVSIADLATFLQPTLTVVDATRVLMRNGPQGGNIADTKEVNQVIATLDQVAADAYACELIGARREDIGYLDIGERRGLGTKTWEDLRRAEV
ncbi:MAG: DUF362 domain-containing protein [Deltaproteobacteria bacterium]|nr:DUF362 domain-containing protein [Deltaproteobacteria bacterium]